MINFLLYKEPETVPTLFASVWLPVGRGCGPVLRELAWLHFSELPGRLGLDFLPINPEPDGGSPVWALLNACLVKHPGLQRSLGLLSWSALLGWQGNLGGDKTLLPELW